MYNSGYVRAVVHIAEPSYVRATGVGFPSAFGAALRSTRQRIHFVRTTSRVRLHRPSVKPTVCVSVLQE